MCHKIKTNRSVAMIFTENKLEIVVVGEVIESGGGDQSFQLFNN